MNRTSKTRASGEIPLYQLKVTLEWSEPAIWRRVIVRGNMTLKRLHDVIQVVMPWTNSHLHQFIAGKGNAATYYGKPHSSFDDMGPEMLNEKRYHISDLAPAAKRKLIYEYDFGDGWEHQIVVEKILPPDATFKHPRCLAGENACPPDDCGGIPGYYRLLEVLADPKDEEHESMKEWIGGPWDPTRFNIEEVNAMLGRLKT